MCSFTFWDNAKLLCFLKIYIKTNAFLSNIMTVFKPFFSLSTPSCFFNSSLFYTNPTIFSKRSFFYSKRFENKLFATILNTDFSIRKKIYLTEIRLVLCIACTETERQTSVFTSMYFFSKTKLTSFFIVKGCSLTICISNLKKHFFRLKR